MHVHSAQPKSEALVSGARASGSVTRRADQFSRYEPRCRSGPSQAWLRRFDSAFVSLFSRLQTSTVKSRLFTGETCRHRVQIRAWPTSFNAPVAQNIRARRFERRGCR